METPENGPQEEETEESRFGEAQSDDLTPLEPGEASIPFSGEAEGGGTPPEGGGPPTDDTKSENPDDLSTGDGGPPPEAFTAPVAVPEGSPPTETGVDTGMDGPPPTEAAPAWEQETSRSGRRAGGKPGRKSGRKPGRKPKANTKPAMEDPGPVVVTQPAPDAPIMVVAVKFMDVAQIFNRAEKYLRVGDAISGGYSDLEMWVDRGVLWVRRWNIKEDKHETNCVPLSNVQSFTPA